MKKTFLSILLTGIIALIGMGAVANVANAGPCLAGYQGGTGLCTATSSNIGQAPVVSSITAQGTPVYQFSNAGGSSSGTAFYANGSLFLTTSTVNFQQGSNITITTSSNGTYTITGVAASGTFTTVTGVEPILFNQVGASATGSYDTNYALTLNALYTFLKGITVNGTTTLASTTNAILYTDGSGHVLGYAGSNPCGAGQAALSISATGTISCVNIVTSTVGNWQGTWQGTNSSTFYLATNPNGYITTSTNNFGGLTNASITALSPIGWSNTSTIYWLGQALWTTSTPTFGGLSVNGNVSTTISGTQCLHVTGNGVIQGTGSDCGSGGGSSTAVYGSYPIQVATGTASATVSIFSSSTAVLNVDGNRGDAYTPNGTTLLPYKTLSGAIASSTGFGAYAYWLSPATYVDGAPDTLPSVPIVIYGNEATIVEPSGATFPAPFDNYDTTWVGNLHESDPAITSIHQFTNGVIIGNLQVDGNATLEGMALPVTTSTFTVSTGSLANIVGSLVDATITANGIQTNLNDDYIGASSSNYAVNSMSGQVIFQGATVINNGVGGGIHLENGATSSSPNIIDNITLTVNSSTPGSGIKTGTSTAAICNLIGSTNFAGTFIAPSGTSYVPCYDEDRTVLNGLSVGTSTTASGGKILTNITPNSVVATDGAGNLTNTSTVSSLGGVTGAIGVGAYLGAGSTLNVSSTLASSSLSMNITVSTTTAGYNTWGYLMPAGGNITSLDCSEYAAATSTTEIAYATSSVNVLANKPAQMIYNGLNCGITDTSVTSGFTTSTVPNGDYLMLITSSTAGTPVHSLFSATYTKL
jgi:hypothetical protein